MKKRIATLMALVSLCLAVCQLLDQRPVKDFGSWLFKLTVSILEAPPSANIHGLPTSEATHALRSAMCVCFGFTIALLMWVLADSRSTKRASYRWLVATAFAWTVLYSLYAAVSPHFTLMPPHRDWFCACSDALVYACAGTTAACAYCLHLEAVRRPVTAWTHRFFAGLTTILALSACVARREDCPFDAVPSPGSDHMVWLWVRLLPSIAMLYLCAMMFVGKVHTRSWKLLVWASTLLYPVLLSLRIQLPTAETDQIIAFFVGITALKPVIVVGYFNASDWPGWRDTDVSQTKLTC